MALHLNLHHEIDKARRMQRRDPLKLSIYGLSAIAGAFAIFYFVELGRMHSLNKQLGAAQAEFRKVEPKAKEAKKLEDELNTQIRQGEAIVKRIEERFYWAPVLDQLMQVVPREVQITRFVGDLSGEGVRKCNFTVDGLSAGADARRIAEELRTAIADKFAPNYHSVTSTFKSLDDGTETVMLDGKQMSTATFAINVQITTSAEEAPAPTRKK